MAERILVSPQELDDIAAKLRRAAAEQDVLTQTTRSLVDKLVSSWEGASTRTRAQALLGLLHDDQQKIQMLNELANELISAANTLRECDADIASSFREAFKA